MNIDNPTHNLQRLTELHERAITKNDESNSLVFSIHTHVLSEEEAWERIMFYAEAIEANELELAKTFETIYNTSFSRFHDEWGENILFCAGYWQKKKYRQKRKFAYCKKYPNGVVTLYKSASKDDFMKIIKSNLEERDPHRDIVFTDSNVCVVFGYDLTIIVYYEGDEMLRVNKIKDVLLSGGFHLIG